MKNIIFLLILFGFSLGLNAQDKTTIVCNIIVEKAALQNTDKQTAERLLNPTLKSSLDKSVSESSGLVWTDGDLWTHNDSKNAAILYKMDTATGAVLQQVTIQNYPNADWEDIAVDDDFIYIGDFGNNNGNRKDLKILKIAKADIGKNAQVTVTAKAINFSYPDQTDFNFNSNTNFNCEAMICFKNALYIFTKNHGDNKTKLYKLPKIEGDYKAEFIGTFDAQGLITGADISPNQKEIMLLGYQSGHTHVFMWRFTDYIDDDFFSRNKQKIIIGDASDWQAEGIAYSDSAHIWISNETSGGKAQSLYTLNKSSILKEIAANIYVLPNEEIIVFPNPTFDGTITLKNLQGSIESIEIIRWDGKVLSVNNWEDLGSFIQIAIPRSPGKYTLKIKLISSKEMNSSFIRL